ncbi:MAG TPA: glycosyltransferase [Pseudolabrys sp.]|jgi:glycosyltransferase involved in cell wall biosynthesis|uniref:glycosyltransferase n=1 Tax=Pseudolabrys sp. TaxID=1960880 RepID=UPI002DDD764F|nr:glycosyltransferase [Pseudolabrys sp.]HEV2628003.1 glycosyltransferase [Pseudolabrys sp.]
MPVQSASASTANAVRVQDPSFAPMRVLIVAPALEGGAADAGAVELTRILQNAGHKAIVVSRAGRLAADINAAGAEFVPLDVATANPVKMLRNAFALRRLARDKRCDCIHALGRSGAWSAFLAARLTRLPFLTSWYKGFRDQNLFKHVYNSVMARGDRVVAVSDQLAQLVNDRYGTPWEKLTVLPCGVDLDRFDPERMTQERIDAIRHAWGVTGETKVILVVGRILRRKGHHVVVKAVDRLKTMGLKDFLCVFVGEDRGRTHYTGELWDLVLSTGTMDVIRMAAPVHDMPAAYAAASVVVSAAIQPEGMQRAILEAQAMGRPVIVSDLAAGTDVVLTAPAVPESRVAGLRFPAGDDSRLAATLLRLFSIPQPMRAAMGGRGRDWVLGHFNAELVAEQTLQLYAEAIGRPAVAGARVAA